MPYPSLVSVVAHMDLAAVVGEVGEHNAQVNEAGEDTSAEPADGCWGLFLVNQARQGIELVTHDLSQVDWSHNYSLADAQSGHEATSIDSPQATVGTDAHENGNSQDPKNAELASRPQPSNTVAHKECTITVSADRLHGSFW